MAAEAAVVPDATTPFVPAMTAQLKLPAGGANVDVTGKDTLTLPGMKVPSAAAAAGGSATEMCAPCTVDAATLPNQLARGTSEGLEVYDTRSALITEATSGTSRFRG
jgi:hypothetical protein